MVRLLTVALPIVGSVIQGIINIEGITPSENILNTESIGEIN